MKGYSIQVISKFRNHHNNTSATQFKPLTGFSPKTTRIKLIEIEYTSDTEKLSPLIQCCKRDSAVVFEIVFDKHKHLYNNIVSLISHSPPQKYHHIEIITLKICILHSIKHGSVNMMKYLLTKYKDQLDQVLIHCLELKDDNTNSLLIEEMKSGNNEIVQTVLKHCKKNESIIIFANNGSKHALLHQACDSDNPQTKTSERLSERTIKLLIDDLNFEKVNQRGVTSIRINNKRKYKAIKDKDLAICDLGECGEVKNIKSCWKFITYREQMPYFTNIIIKQMIHCGKVKLKVFHDNDRTSLMNACIMKDNIALRTCCKITIDFSYSISRWNSLHFAV